MNCNTVKDGLFCMYMSQDGVCKHHKGGCQKVVDKCKDCDRITEYKGDNYCFTYPEPDIRWSYGRCPLCSTTERLVKVEKFLNPLKASKKKSRKKV